MAFLLLPFFLSPVPKNKEAMMPGGTKASVVFEKDSFYGNLKVVDYSYRDIHTRELIIDGLVQGGIDVANGMSVYEYSYFMGFIPYSLNPEGKSCLVIGLGPGIVPVWYEKMGIRTDIVDIDPNVVDIARDYFGFRVTGDVVISDARYFLMKSTKAYDYIILDVFNGDTTPGHVLSIEALRLVKARLSPRGVLAVNLVGSLRKETFMTASVMKTLNAVFETVEIFPTFPEGEKDGSGNLAVIAYDYPKADTNNELLKNLPVHPLAGAVRELIGKKAAFAQDKHAIILSDDFNPIDFYDSWLREKVRKEIIESTSHDILI